MIALSLLISSCKVSIFSCTETFKQILFLINFALWTNFKVLIVSPTLIKLLLMLAIIVVLEFPPNESFKKKVNLLSRKGIYFPLPSATSTKALITLPKVDKDLFIIHASFILSPKVFVFFCLSLPAKSIKCNLLLF